MRGNKNLPVKRMIYSKSANLFTHFFLLVLFALLPFVFSDRLIETETTFRFIASGILVSISFLFLLSGLIMNEDINIPSFGRNHFYKILLVFIISTGITLLNTINKGEAIYDYLKIFVLVSYLVLFVILIKNRGNFLTLLLKYANIPVWIFTLITLSQIGLRLQIGGLIKIDYLISSSLGNKNFYAETMTLILPLILMGVVILSGFWRMVSIINIFIILVTIVALQTLSTWVAMVILILFMVIMLVYLDWRKSLSFTINSKNGIALIMGAVIVVTVSIPVLYRVNQFNLITKRVDKMSEYVKTNNGHQHEDTYHTNSISERVFLWQNALRIFKDNPVIGVGFDNWKIYSTKYKLPFSEYAMNNSTRYIRPHNDLLLILAEGGVVCFLLFIGLFVYAFVIAFKLFRSSLSRDGKIAVLLSLSGLIMYLTIACFSLPGDRFYTQVFLFIYFAIVCGYYDISISSVSTHGRRIMIIVCFIAIITGLSLSYIGSKRYASEVHLIYALQAQSKSDWKKMSYHAAMAKTFFFPMDYTATPIAWYQGMAAFNSGSPSISKYYFEEALHINPYDLHVLNDLATSLQREGDNAKAIKIYDKALALAPYFTSAFMNKVVVLYDQGDRTQAYEFLHTYPTDYMDDDYNRILTIMLRDKAKEVIADSLKSRRYLKDKRDLLRMDSLATVEHIPFEQLVLRDSALTRLK